MAPSRRPIFQRLPRHIVQTKDQVAGEFIEQAVFHHDPTAVQQLFGGLKISCSVPLNCRVRARYSAA
jgi:hypothetical protein